MLKLMYPTTATYQPRLKRLIWILVAGMILVFLVISLSTPEEVGSFGITVNGFFHIFSMALVLIGTVSIVTIIPPIIQVLLRGSATIELSNEGILLAIGLDRRHQISWREISSIRSVQLSSPVSVGWINIVFTEHRRHLGEELSIPDLYLDQDVMTVAKGMNDHLERWRYPFGRPVHPERDQGE